MAYDTISSGGLQELRLLFQGPQLLPRGHRPLLAPAEDRRDLRAEHRHEAVHLRDLKPFDYHC